MTDRLRQLGTLRPFPRADLALDAPGAALALLGAVLARREDDGSWSHVRIVETEAYREDDPASHSAAGRTARTTPMFEQAGTAYVYRSYGVHWCLNVTAEEVGLGAAALVRAAVALDGHEHLRARRPTARDDRELLRGPGRLCQALDIDGPRHTGRDLLDPGADVQLLTDGYRPPPSQVVTGPRTGIRLAADVPWRFAVAGVAEVSPYRRHPSAPLPG